MLSKILRIVVAIIGGVLGYAFGVMILLLVEATDAGESLIFSPVLEIAVPIVFAVIFLITFYAAFPSIKGRGKKIVNRIEGDLQSVPFNDLVSGTAGLICGLIIAWFVSQPLMRIEIYLIGPALSVAAYLFLGYLGITVATTGVRRELKNATEGKKSIFNSTPKIKPAKNSEAMPKIFDTSVIIDGRIADILDTGFLEGKIIIPEFVLEELRHISDSSDPMKRIRGRRGLDVLKNIQNTQGIEIFNTYNKSFIGITEVDVKLLKLAELLRGKVVTNDYNLIKVAEIQGIEVLNINELVKALRPVIIPGETMQIYILREGKENNQGVGYMDDGTMIVVEDGRRLLGQEVYVEVTSVLQTASGRMIFAKPKNRR